MPQPNQRWPNLAQPNGPPPAETHFVPAGDDGADVRIIVREVLSEDGDVRLLIGVPSSQDADLMIKVTEVLADDADTKLTIALTGSDDADLAIVVFNPLPLSDDADVRVVVFNPEPHSDDADLLLDITEVYAQNADTRLEVVEQVASDADLRLLVDEVASDQADVAINIHTDINDPDVVAIATILERRFLPFFGQSVMFRPGADTERYKLFWALGTAEYQARQQLESMLGNLRLLLASGRHLDWVGDRVGELRWQFYADRVDRFESDTAYRNRLIPYFRQRRGSLDDLQAAVQPLHDAYGGSSAFYSYTIADGWQIGHPVRSDLGNSTFLGGPLRNFNPLEYLRDTDIWVLGTGLRSGLSGIISPVTGRTQVVGNSTRFKTELHVGDQLYWFNPVPSEYVLIGEVERIRSNTLLELTRPAGAGYNEGYYLPYFARIGEGQNDGDAPSHSVLGLSTWLGDRERFTPFTFLVVVNNYSDDEAWRQLYLHTIDRFRAAGTLPIVVFRRRTMLQQVVIPGDGTDTYTIPSVHLQGENVIVFVDGVGQEPDTYQLTTVGDDTEIEFSETIAIGLNIWINWVEEA